MKKKFITPENRLILTIFSSIVLIVALVCLVRFTLPALVEKIELKSFDWRAQMASEKLQHSSDVVLLVVDDISLQNAASHPELSLSRWPWPRSAHADIIKYLNAAGAKAIVFDILFEGVEGNSESNIASDNTLIEAVKQSNNVFFAISFSYSKKSLLKYREKGKIYEQNILKISSDQLKEDIKKFAIFPDIIDVNKEILTNIEFYNVTNVLKGLLVNAKNIGSVGLPFNLDGIARTSRPVTIFNKNYYPSLPLAVYMSLNPDTNITIKDSTFYLGDKEIQLDSYGGHFINWYGPPSTFKHYRALDVILAQKVIDSGQKNPLDYSRFKDKIVVIGLTATATDILPTPMAGAYPGPEFVATIINNYLTSDKFISKLPDKYTFLITFLFCLIIGASILFFRSGLNSICLSILLLGGYIYLCVYSFVSKFVWIEMVFPTLVILLTIMVTFMSKYVITRKAYEDTYKIATTDGLTGLFNHRYFQETLAVLIQRAQRFNYDLSLLLIDIDNFKQVNDTYGHRAGDKVLKDVSARIVKCLRSTDIVARYGGEEIAVILDNTAISNAMIAANKVLSVINSEEFKLSSELSLKITVSIGISGFPTNASNQTELIEIADQGLYYAKENGKNRIGFRHGELLPLIEESEGQDGKGDYVDIKLVVDRDTFNDLSEKAKTTNTAEIATWVIQQLKQKD